MDFGERLGYLMVGCLIGFILGYIVRSLRDIKEELDEVADEMKHNRNEDGIVRNPIVLDIALLLVVVLTVWASFSSQKASNDIQDTQDQLLRVTTCTKTTLTKTVEALNQRTTYTQDQTEANVNLQRAQVEFLQTLFQEPPSTEKQRKDALRHYFDSLTKFVTVAGAARQKAAFYPYPTTDDLNNCLYPSK